MRVLLVTENQAAAVRVDRGQVDAVAAQVTMQSKSRGCAPRSSSSAERVSAAAGEDDILGLCGLSMLADIVLHCRIGVGKLEFYRDFTAFVYINHVDQLNNDLARQRL